MYTRQLKIRQGEWYDIYITNKTMIKQLEATYIIIYDTGIIHEIEDLAIATAKLEADKKYIIAAMSKVWNIYLTLDLNK